MAEADNPLPSGIDIIDLSRLGLDGLRRLTGDDFEELRRAVLAEIGDCPPAWSGYSTSLDDGGLIWEPDPGAELNERWMEAGGRDPDDVEEDAPASETGEAIARDPGETSRNTQDDQAVKDDSDHR